MRGREKEREKKWERRKEKSERETKPNTFHRFPNTFSSYKLQNEKEYLVLDLGKENNIGKQFWEAGK